VPGKPNVARAPLDEKFIVAPPPPIEREAPLPDRFMRTPGSSLIDRRKRKLTEQS
jgi:hypothetical protein